MPSSSEYTLLFRPVGKKELELIEESGFKRFPPRLEHQPIFYPVLNQEYAQQIAERWNTKDVASGYEGHVTRFKVKNLFLKQYSVETVGPGSLHEEYWIPAGDLEELNDNIVDLIEVISSFK